MKSNYSYFLFYLLLAYSLFSNIQLTYQNNEEYVEFGIKHYLVFQITYIHFSYPFIYIQHHLNEGKILFNGTEYSSGDQIKYKQGRYPLGAILDQKYKFLAWHSSENIIIENRFSPNTFALLLPPSYSILPTITQIEVESTITMIVTDNSFPSLPVNNLGFPIYFGNLTKNSLQIVNKINNNPNIKFVPFESIKINNIIEVNETKPYTNNPTYNEKTEIFINNTIFVNDTLIKREGTNILKIKSLNYNYFENYNGLIDVRKTYSVVYPERNYGLGIADSFGSYIIASLSIVKIKWSWYELSNQGYVYKEKIKNLYGINITSLIISNLLLELLNVSHTQNEININFQLKWSDDLNNALFKENVFSLNFIELGKSIGNSDSTGKINATLNYQEINNLDKIAGYIKVKIQFKGNGTLLNNYEFLVKWIKLATIVKEKILTNDQLKLKIKVVEFENFTEIKNVLIMLFADNRLIAYNLTDERGETIFNVLIQENYRKIYIKLLPSYFNAILISSELSDITIDVKI